MSKGCPLPEQISQYLEGELSPAEADRVQIHLDTCAECREIAHSLESVTTELRALPQAPVSETFTERVMARTKLEKMGKTSFSLSSILILLGLAAGIFVVLGLLPKGSGGEPVIMTPLFKNIFSSLEDPAQAEATGILLQGAAAMLKGTIIFLLFDLGIILGLSKFLWKKRLAVNVMKAMILLLLIFNILPAFAESPQPTATHTMTSSSPAAANGEKTPHQPESKHPDPSASPSPAWLTPLPEDRMHVINPETKTIIDKPVVSKGENGRTLYTYWGQTPTIDRNEIIDGDVLCLGCILMVKGRIKGSVVMVGGGVVPETGSVIEKNVTLLMGELTEKPGSQIRGKITKQLILPKEIAMSFFTASLIARIALEMVGSFSDIILALLLFMFAKKRILSVCNHLVESPGKSLIWGIGGLLAYFLIVGAAMIPFRLSPLVFLIGWAVLTAFFMLLLAMSNASIAYLIGQSFEDRGWIGKRQFTIKGLLGLFVIATLVVGINAIPAVGPFIAQIIASIIRVAGIGATLILWFTRKPKESN